jgi:RHS repeat-associated protein
LLDVSGAKTDAYTYEAFGSTVNSTGNDPNPYRFAGERLVDSVGFYQNRARWLDTRTGRFVSVDPMIGYDSNDPVTLAPYLYGSASPIAEFDPTGQFSISETQMVQIAQATLFAVNMYGAIQNTRASLEFGLAAYSYVNDDDPWNATIATGIAALFGVAAAGNIAGMKGAMTGPPAGMASIAFSGGGAVGAVQRVWASEAAREWILVNGMRALGGVVASSFARMKAGWELREPNGQIATRGNMESGGRKLGHRPSWTEQRAGDCEQKIMSLLAIGSGKLKSALLRVGRILTIRGELPPCPSCQGKMQEFSVKNGIKIYYKEAGNPTPWMFPRP